MQGSRSSHVDQIMTYAAAHFRTRATDRDAAGPVSTRTLVEEWPSAWCVSLDVAGNPENMEFLLKTEWERVQLKPVADGREWVRYE